MRRSEVSGTVCLNDGCTRQRIKGSVMCITHTEAIRSGKAGPNKTSDGVRLGRTRKLTDEQVTELRKMWSQFKSQKEIAAHFGVSVDTVRAYIRRSRSGA